MGVLVVKNKAINMAYVRELEATPSSNGIRIVLRDPSGRKVAEYMTKTSENPCDVCREILKIAKNLFHSSRSVEITDIVRTAEERAKRCRCEVRVQAECTT